MRILLRKHTWYTAVILLALGGAVLWVVTHQNNNRETYITATVETGPVRELVSVSGFIEAKNTAELAFPATGKVTEVFVDEGSVVQAGEVLATLGGAELVADRTEALAALRLAQAQLNETVAGPTNEARAVTNTKVANAEQNLARVSSEQAEKVMNARAALLSTNLEALSVDPQETAAAPTVSGTYTCLEEGEYRLRVYNSSAYSGYSYRLTGLREGTSAAFTDQPAPLDDCGLFIQFDEASNYVNSEWVITIPNTRGATYVANKNAYELALEQQANAIAAAEDALDLALEEASAANATARSEVVDQRRAAVDQARARIAVIDARLADRSIVAPFAGIVTDVSVLPGETVSSAPVITLLAEDAFELTARIPEIDITKITVGQAVETVFDAKADEALTGTISYISPLATEIDGVAYFETTVTLDAKPDWIRSGLNADLDIIVAENNTTRLPKRFVTETTTGYSVHVRSGEVIKAVPIDVLFEGNDGYVAVAGIEVGTEVIAP